MEWFLLLLLSSLASGAIAYFLKEDKIIDDQTSLQKELKNKDKEKIEKEASQKISETPIPEVKQKISFKVDPEDIYKFKDFIKKAPSPLQPEVKETDNLKKTIENLKQDLYKKKKPLKVTYTTDEIIPRYSPFSRHRRPLQNAEKFVEEQKAKEALSIYERLEKRIPDEEIKKKIQTNIEDIKKWLLGIEEEEAIEFPEIIIPLKTETVALEQFNEGLRKISEDIAKEISRILNDGIKEIKTNLNIQDAQIRTKEIHTDSLNIEQKPSIDFDIKKDTTIPPNIPDYQDNKTKEIPQSKQEPQQIIYYYIPSFAREIPKTLQKLKGIPELKVSQIPFPIGPKVPTKPEEYLENIISKEGFEFDEEGNLITEGWTDKDFEREWEKYKHLPLIDRRSGKDRRKDYKFEPNRPDRRSGEDRRKINLFEERDKFLEKYQKHLERKKLLEEQKEYTPTQLFVPENNIIVVNQQNTEDLLEIDLPDPITEKFEDLQESIKSLDINVDSIVKEAYPEETQEINTKSISKEIESLESNIKSSEEEQLEELNLPESFETEIPHTLELPETELSEDIEIIEKQQESSTSKIEIIPPRLEILNLPDPETEILEPEEFEDKEDEEIKEEKENTQDLISEEIAEVPSQESPIPASTQQESQKEQLGEGVEDVDFPEMPDVPETKGPVQEIRGVLELKPPDEDDAPFLVLTYDFSKIPDSFQLSKNYHTLEYVYYKYKPLLIKAQEFARRKMLKNALNYYRMIKSQNIPPEFKRMINRNIQDITDYIEKFMMSRTND